MNPFYSISEIGSTAVIADGYDKLEVIDNAENWLHCTLGEDGHVGKYSEWYTLTTEIDGVETEETITLSVDVERDTYDGGRSDYYFGQMGA